MEVHPEGLLSTADENAKYKITMRDKAPSASQDNFYHKQQQQQNTHKKYIFLSPNQLDSGKREPRSLLLWNLSPKSRGWQWGRHQIIVFIYLFICLWAAMSAMGKKKVEGWVFWAFLSNTVTIFCNARYVRVLEEKMVQTNKNININEKRKLSVLNKDNV